MKRVYQMAGLGSFIIAGWGVGWSPAGSAVAAEQTGAAKAALVQAAAEKDNVCTECHDPSSPKHTLVVYQTRHGVKADGRAPSCQACHGESLIHNKDPKLPTEIVFGEKSKNISSADIRNATCLTCHEAKARANWAGSEHESRGVACTTCHNIHAPDQKVLTKATQSDVCFSCHKTQRAQVHRISAHPLAGTSLSNAPKMSCSDCHNPHGSTSPNLMAKGSINETCYTCHAEKRGPFLWEHAPVTEDCTSCHTPHGSANAPLLKVRQPVLCQDCHSGDHANQVGSAGNLKSGGVTTFNGTQAAAASAPRQQLNARACIACHPLVHGSNHPAGAKFIR